MADDSVLLREGLVGLLERQGYEIVGQEHQVDAPLAIVAELVGHDAPPDAVIIDVWMPPTMINDGLRAAIRTKGDHPWVVVLVLSQYVSPLYAQELFAPPAPPGAGGAGCLLRDRVAQVADFIGALRMMVGRGVVVDPEVARAMMQTSRSGLGELTPRELEVMELMARGFSNNQIAGRLFLSGAAMAKRVPSIFSKFGFGLGDENCRVRVILAFLSCPTF